MKINPIIKRFYASASLKKLNNKLLLLGNNKLNINKFLITKLILVILVFTISFFVLSMGYIVSPIASIIVYIIYDYYYLDLKIKKRADTLEHDAIFFFEALALSLQNESNLKVCLDVTTSSIDSDLSNEFKEALKEVKLGKSLNEALENLRKRIPSKTVNNVILNLIESNTYGTSIVDALNNQIDYITDKRILEIKGQINKMPTRISIVSVLFFVPIIILLVLGPVLINYFIK